MRDAEERKARRQEASIREYQERRQSLRLSSPPDPATDRQLEYIRHLGGDIPIGLTKSNASLIIDHLTEHPNQPTSRQIMVLRFWNRMDLANLSRREIAEWQNRFYAEDPLRKAAWTLYKFKTKDDGSQHDPSWVEIGAGENFYQMAGDSNRYPSCLESGAGENRRREIAAYRWRFGLICLGSILLAWLLSKILIAII